MKQPAEETALMKKLLLVLLPVLFVPFGPFANAQNFPAKPIKLLVGAPAGGTTDTLARAIGQEMTMTLGQPIIVENRPGAGGNLAADAVAKSSPDGYTLLMSFTSHTINASLYSKLTFDTLKDFTPISMVATVPSVLVAHPSLPVDDVPSLIKLAKEKPGKLNFAIGALGSSLHLAGDMFKTMASVDIVNVPYKGTAPAMTDLVGGQVELMFASVVTASPQIKSGKLKAIGTTSAKPLAAFPKVAPIAETLPGYESNAWFGVFGPAKLSPEVLKTLNSAIVKAVNAPPIKARLEIEGAEAIGNTPDQFAAFVKTDIEKWAKVVKATGAKAE
jgi:tripartite-type tricarboxylate transporter receptor subunit TctC